MESIDDEINLLDSEFYGKEVAERFYKQDDVIVFEENKISSDSRMMNFDDEFLAQSKLFTTLRLSGNVDLGEVTVTIEISGSAKPIDATSCHIYFKREFLEGSTLTTKWDQVIPRDEVKKQDMAFSIYPVGNQKFEFKHLFNIGKYTAARLIFFGPGFSTLADQMANVTAFEVTTTQIRIKKPIIEIKNSEVLSPAADGKLKIPFIIKYPAKTWVQYGGWWAMAKGGGQGENLFRQVWVKYANQANGDVVLAGNTKISDGPDAFWYNEGEFVFDMPDNAGIYNLQFGLFDNSWKDPYNWVWPGVDVQVGGDSWIQKCPVEQMPPRLRVKNGKFVKLDGTPFDFYEGTNGGKAIAAVRGGSWGNAYGWTKTPALNKSGFFGSLKYLGHKWVRFLFNPDTYTEDPVYRNRILDSIHKILLAGLYPLVGMHNMHVNVSSKVERDKKFLELTEMLAHDWKGLPVLFPVLNEPKELSGWDETYDLCEKACRLIRSIDPDAFLIVPCKGYSKTITTDEANKLLPADLVDLYSYHPYNKPKDVLPFMKPLLDTGVGVMVEEYGCGNLTWFKNLNIEMQKISKLYPNFLMFGTWAWTVKGQDGCPLVLDGSKANIELTESGNMVYIDMKIWDSGNFIDESGNITLPSVDSDGNVDSGSGNSGNTGDNNNTGNGTTINLNNYFTKTEIETLFDNKFNTLSESFDDKFESLSKKIDNLNNSNDYDLPYSEIQNYIMGLQNCQLLSISAMPNWAVQLKDSKLIIKLTAPVPKGGLQIFLNTTNDRILVPASVQLNEGQNEIIVDIQTLAVTSNTTARISAVLNGKTLTTNFTVRVK